MSMRLSAFSVGEMKGESGLVQLDKLLDEGKKQMRKERNQEQKRGKSSNPVVP